MKPEFPDWKFGLFFCLESKVGWNADNPLDQHYPRSTLPWEFPKAINPKIGPIAKKT